MQLKHLFPIEIWMLIFEFDNTFHEIMKTQILNRVILNSKRCFFPRINCIRNISYQFLVAFDKSSHLRIVKNKNIILYTLKCISCGLVICTSLVKEN